MFYFLILLGGALAAFLLARRHRHSADNPHGVIDAPAQVRAAAKRLGYSAEPNAHPIQSIGDPALCIAAMADAFTQMDPHAGKPARDAMDLSLRKHLKVAPDAARDMETFGPWLIAEGGGPTPAFDRLTKRLKQLDHGPYFSKLMSVLGDVAAAGSRGMPSASQADALGALARVFRTA